MVSQGFWLFSLVRWTVIGDRMSTKGKRGLQEKISGVVRPIYAGGKPTDDRAAVFSKPSKPRHTEL